MNFNTMRQEFPIFKKASGQNPLVYLDNAATTHKPDSVINAITNFYRSGYATVHRALYPLGESATELYEGVRDSVASFINAANREEIIFTKGTTESINCFAQSWGLKNLKPGDQILLTQAEHHANLLPWQHVAQETGAQLVFIPVDPKTYNLVNPLAYITPRTKLVAISADSNVLGPLWDDRTDELKNFIACAHAQGATVLLDAAQSIAHTRLDVQYLGADAVVFSGHKMFGPTGVGVLYATQALQKTMNPYQLGGSMVYEASFFNATWQTGAQKFEAGTPPIAEVIGLGAAIDFIREKIDFDALHKHEASLCQKIIAGLKTIPNVIIIMSELGKTHGTHVVSFTVSGIHPHDLACDLGQKNIAIRAGHHCAQPLITHLGFEAVLRVSVTVYNTSEEIDAFINQLKSSVATFKNLMDHHGQ